MSSSSSSAQHIIFQHVTNYILSKPPRTSSEATASARRMFTIPSAHTVTFYVRLPGDITAQVDENAWEVGFAPNTVLEVRSAPAPAAPTPVVAREVEEENGLEALLERVKQGNARSTSPPPTTTSSTDRTFTFDHTGSISNTPSTSSPKPELGILSPLDRSVDAFASPVGTSPPPLRDDGFEFPTRSVVRSVPTPLVSPKSQPPPQPQPQTQPTPPTQPQPQSSKFLFKDALTDSVLVTDDAWRLQMRASAAGSSVGSVTSSVMRRTGSLDIKRIKNASPHGLLARTLSAPSIPVYVGVTIYLTLSSSSSPSPQKTQTGTGPRSPTSSKRQSPGIPISFDRRLQLSHLFSAAAEKWGVAVERVELTWLPSGPTGAEGLVRAKKLEASQTVGDVGMSTGAVVMVRVKPEKRVAAVDMGFLKDESLSGREGDRRDRLPLGFRASTQATVVI